MEEILRWAALGGAIVAGLALLIRPVWGLLSLVLLIPLLTRWIPRGGHGLNAETVLFILAMLVIVLRVRPALPPIRVLAPFVAYYASVLFGFAVLATWYGLEPRGGKSLFYWAEAMKSDVWPTMLFFISFALASDAVIRRRVLGCMIIGLLLYAVSGVFDYQAGVTEVTIAEYYRPAGALAANPNLLGGHLAAFSVLALMGVFRRESPMLIRVLCGGVYLLGFGVLLLTQSRGAWLGFLAAHAVWLFYVNRKLLAPAALAFVLVGTVGYSLSMLPAAVERRIDDTLTPGRYVFQGTGVAGRFDSSVDIRVALYKMGGEMFLASPLWGHGYRGFRFLTNDYGAKYGVWRGHGLGVDSESILLSIAVDNGLIGLAALAWLSWMLLARGLVLARDGGDERALGITFLCICAAVGAESLTQNALNAHEISLPFWLLAGLVVRAFHDRQLAMAPQVRPLLGAAPPAAGHLGPAA